MRKILLLSVVGILAFCWQVCAQSRTITGTVRSATDNNALPGVNVLVKGSSTGTTTNADGAYSISVPDRRHAGFQLCSQGSRRSTGGKPECN